MDVKDIKAVIGTNACGSGLYGKAIRGSAVSEDILKEAVEKAVELDMTVFDMSGNYKQDQVRNSLMKDLEQMNREAIDIYWLHLPNSIDENIKEMITLYREEKILNIGVSNFTLEECKKVKEILDAENIPFWQMTAKNENARYVCINKGDDYIPAEIADQSICINSDINDILLSI